MMYHPSVLALRFPTVLPHWPPLPNGQCYLLLPSGPITVRVLLREKTRAELRKARAGGLHCSSLPLLLPPDTTLSLREADEALAIRGVETAFDDGLLILLVDGTVVAALDEVIVLTARTRLELVAVDAAVADGAEQTSLPTYGARG